MRDKGFSDQGSRTGDLEHAKDLLSKLRSEIREYVEKQFSVQIR